MCGNLQAKEAVALYESTCEDLPLSEYVEKHTALMEGCGGERNIRGCIGEGQVV